jgi:hypothetical protein
MMGDRNVGAVVWVYWKEMKARIKSQLDSRRRRRREKRMIG